MKIKTKLKSEKGITLVALVITIVILIILATVGISAVFGNNGLIKRAEDTKKFQTNAEVQENQFYGEAEDIINETLEGTGGGKREKISKEESYVGYYADIDSDGTVDGIIYADLAVGNTADGQWTDSDGKYRIPIVDEVRDYYISQTGYEGVFGTKDVLSPIRSGRKQRFYVMALEDVNGKGIRYCWYDAAYGNMDDHNTATSENFEEGKANTSKMIRKWDAEKYGKQDQGSDKDMWGQIKEKVEKGWFVPSKGEWSAFGEELGITKDNYEKYNLSDWYWSSSQGDTDRAWLAHFNDGYMGRGNVNNTNCVRLSTTF